MQRSIFFFICLFALQAPARPALSAQTPPPPTSEEAAFRIDSVQADFTQEKHLKILARPIISTGRLMFQAPRSLRWEYTSPFSSVLLMHEGRVKRILERDGRLQEETGMQLDAMQVVLTEISNWLDGRFTENELFTVSFPDSRTVLLVPKDRAFGGLIEKIELKLADRKGLLDRVSVVEGPDASTVMIFTNRVLNQDIPIASFTQL